ncbi:MAG: glutamine-hydrolyzing carbamoyl-phosphate synthase small subunit [Acidimicrobiales bacterium]
MPRPAGLLVLADGTAFEGETVGWQGGGISTGELVFNTVLTGYQEVLTDPSYAGQVVCFTYPHIGNYGVAPADDEARRPFCRGVVVRDLSEPSAGRQPASWRSGETLQSFLARHGVAGLSGVDTRRLTRHVRDEGSMPCAFAAVEGEGAVPEAEIVSAAAAAAGTEGVDLVSEVTTPRPYQVPARPGAGEGLRVVAYDLGIKRHILDHLAALGDVEVVPASTPAGDVLDRRPDGVFLSNGPGDPAALGAVAATVGELLGRVPVMGICLGHQLLGTALGGSTYKLAFGHHGGNHPVRRRRDGAVEITAQNHSYALAGGSLPPGVEVTHVNLNDAVVEGIACPDRLAFSVQYHPEAGPGPHDAGYLFDDFASLMARSRSR